MTDFSTFMKAIPEGRPPYPWQESFARAAAESRPPEIVNVPTGCGKTTVVEALVWALATQADRPHLERTVGVRTVWAIDRRILVDEVFARANLLADALDAAWQGGNPEDPLFEVAMRLQSLKAPGGSPVETVVGPPLLATRWRGGLKLAAPAQHPLQAEIITSTIGQIGSRLLFRGYGLGSRSLQMGAALAACDTTICLDEAHLSEPFATTARAIAAKREEESEPVAPLASVIRLSATLESADDGPAARSIGLSDEDRNVLADRLGAPKTASLVDPEDDSEAGQAAAILAALENHLEAGSRKVACIANSVRVARMVFDQVEKKIKNVDQVLLVGPQRPADRSRLFDEPVSVDREKSPEDTPTRRSVLFEDAEPPVPLIAIATQTIEVGVDIDVDAMVTQSASAGALTQRFGRLNRAGRPGASGRATVVRQRDFPLYALDENRAWRWLESLPGAPDSKDISVDALLAHPAPPPLARGLAPPLTEDLVARLVETNPVPHEMANPEIDPLLRGVDADPDDDVTLFWRSDLHEDDWSAGTYRDALLTLAPPGATERLSLGLRATRNLLRNLTGVARARGAALWRQTLGGADMEGDGIDEARFAPIEGALDRIPFFVLRDRKWLPGSTESSGTDTVGIWQIRAGDLIAVPTSFGGVDEFGLAPDAELGSDVAEDLLPVPSDPEAPPPPIRVTHGALMEALAPDRPDRGPRAQHVDRLLRQVGALGREIERSEPDSPARIDLVKRVFEALEQHPRIADLDPENVTLRRIGGFLDPEAGLLEAETAAYERIEGFEDDADAPAPMAVLEGEETARVATGWVIVPQAEDREALRDWAEQPPTIAEHCLAVADRAELFARSSGLSEAMVETFRLAGLCHDLGKADPRMQGFFHGGIAPAVGEPLAKSTFGTADRSRSAAAASSAGLPRALRHEQASVEIMSDAIDAGHLQPADPDLLFHLGSSHHGMAHPIPPVPEGGLPPRPFAVRANGIEGRAPGDAGQGWGDGESLHRATRLRRRYGPWALAYLETLLVLADRTVSAEGR